MICDTGTGAGCFVTRIDIFYLFTCFDHLSGGTVSGWLGLPPSVFYFTYGFGKSLFPQMIKGFRQVLRLFDGTLYEGVII
jgi:hypothetical protein